jgi:hypothetical protein
LPQRDNLPPIGNNRQGAVLQAKNTAQNQMAEETMSPEELTKKMRYLEK